MISADALCFLGTVGGRKAGRGLGCGDEAWDESGPGMVLRVGGGPGVGMGPL